MNSLAPVALIIVIVGSILGIRFWMQRRRRQGFQAAAATFGFVAVEGSDIPVLSEFPLFDHNGRIRAAAKGNRNDLLACIFDYSYSRGKSSVTQTCVSFTKLGGKLNLPIFQLRTRRFTDRLASFLNSEIVEFPDDRSFSERFSVRSPMPDIVREFLGPEIRAFLAQVPDGTVTIEGYRDAILVYAEGWPVPIEGLKQFLGHVGEIAEGLLAVISSGRVLRVSS